MTTAGLVPSLRQRGLGAGSEPLLRAGHGPPPQPARGAGGRARRPGLGGLRPRSTGPPRDAAQALVRSASWVSGASPAGGSHRTPLGFTRTPGGEKSPDRRARVRAGTQDPRPSRPGKGLPGRCLRAWRGVCALRSMSRGGCSRAAEKSAAVPLPVEAAAVAAAEDAHWWSRRSPSRHRPRPRCASTRTRAPPRQVPPP